jgi:hypothetical protein
MIDSKTGALGPPPDDQAAPAGEFSTTVSFCALGNNGPQKNELHGLSDTAMNFSLVATLKEDGGKHNNSNEAPNRLSPPPTITRLTISGDESVDENSSANYTATATFSDGSTQNVTAKINWSEDSPYAGINSGVLTTADVPNDHTVFITAAYSNGRVAKGAIKQVTIADLPPTLRSLTISGGDSVEENSSASYTATAIFSDGTIQIVTRDATWSEDSPYVGIYAGVLTTADVPSDRTVFITAGYSNGRVAKGAIKQVTVADLAPRLSSLNPEAANLDPAKSRRGGTRTRASLLGGTFLRGAESHLWSSTLQSRPGRNCACPYLAHLDTIFLARPE